jgi:Na+/melibiose symporter-like transporter
VPDRSRALPALWRLLADHRDYRLLLSAGLVSLVGDWLLRVGLTFLVYDLTGSTLASGLMLLSTYLPQVLLASLAGVLVDQWDRRRTMVTTNLLQALGLLPLLAVDGADRVWVVYLVGLAQGCLVLFFVPAEQATVPHLVPAGDLLAANAVNAQNRDVARLVGSAAGGLVATWGGIGGLALVDSATFVASALLLTALAARPPRPPAHERGGMSAGVRRIRRDWVSGLRLVVDHPGLRLLLVFAVITTTGEGIMGTLFAPFVHDVLHGDGTAYGLILGFQSIGGIAGGLAVASIGRAWSPGLLFGWGCIAFGALDLALFLYPLAWPHVAPALVLMVLIGLPGACAVAGFMTMLQTMTDDSYRGRVFGALTAVEAVALLFGIGLASWLGEAVGIVPVIAVQGAGYVVGGGLVLAALPRHAAAPPSARA